jgi:hypothetical protein
MKVVSTWPLMYWVWSKDGQVEGDGGRDPLDDVLGQRPLHRRHRLLARLLWTISLPIIES